MKHFLLLLTLFAFLPLLSCGGDDSDDRDREDGDDPSYTDGDSSPDPDGDSVILPDGDTVSPDGDDPDACDGACDMDTDTTNCMGDDLCICEQGQWVFYNCDTVCAVDGEVSNGCGDAGMNFDYCICDEQTEDGDDPVEDGDDPVEDGDYVPSDWVCPSFGYMLDKGVNTAFPTAAGARDFTLVIPDVASTSAEPLPVIFFWYGSGGNMADWTSGFGVTSHANNADFPFIGVVPKSLNLMPPGKVAFDWDCLAYDNANPGANVDTVLFGDVLDCLEEAMNVDEDHVHSVGFSAGAIMSNLVSTAYSDRIASVASFSGAYFSDANQVQCILGMCAQWSPFTTNNKFPALITWGGAADTYSLVVMTFDFGDAAQKSISYLNGMGHDAVSCMHDGGHTYYTNFSQRFYDFFSDHPRDGGPSPYADGMPASLASCNYKPGN